MWEIYIYIYIYHVPGGIVVKTSPANARDIGSVPGAGRPHVPQDS